MMASLLQARSWLGGALHRRPGPARLPKLPPQPIKLEKSCTTAPSLVTAAAAVEAPTASADHAAQPCRRPLYLLHRHLPRSSGTQDGSVSQEQLHKLHDDLKAMEKVAKRAAWFSAIEAEDGEHILLLTDCPKLGRKYGLQAMPEDASTFSLDLPGRSLEVPLAEVAASLMAQRAQERSSGDDSDDDEGAEMRQAAAVAMADKEAEKAAKKQRKEEEKAAKKLAKAEAKKTESGEESEDESDTEEEEDRGKKTKAEKKEEKKELKMEKEEKKEEKKKGKEEKKMKMEKDESDSESDEEEVGATGGAMGAKCQEGAKVNVGTMGKMEESGSDSEEEESGSDSSEDEEAMVGVMAPGAAEVEPAVCEQGGKQEESGSESDGSESDEGSSGSESEDEEMAEVKAGAKAVEIGEMKPLEA